MPDTTHRPGCEPDEPEVTRDLPRAKRGPLGPAGRLGDMSYRLVDRVPTPDEHRALAVSVGWGDAFRWDVMPASLQGSCCGVVAISDDGTVVAMGRVVGDNAFFFYLQDIAVRPESQGQGLGTRVTERLLDLVHERSGGDAFVGLFATAEAQPVYARLGFDGRSSMAGMWQMLRQRP